MDNILAHGMKGFRLLCWAFSLPCGDSLGLKTKPLAYCMGMSAPPPPHPPLLPRKLGFHPWAPCCQLALF